MAIESPLPSLTGNTYFLSDTNSLTFARWLGGTLICAEDMYGRRDCSYTFIGIELHKGGWSCVRIMNERKQMLMQLAEQVLRNPIDVYYSVAHETIHLLAPGAGATVAIEEGVAEVFASQLVEWQTGIKDYPRKRRNPRCYLEAADAAREFEALYGPRAVKQLRAIEPQWRSMKPEHFAHFEGIDPALVARLLMPMPPLPEMRMRAD